MQQLPAVIKAKAAGGNAQQNAAISNVLSSLTSPEDTFGVVEKRAPGPREPVALRARATWSSARSWPARRRRSGRRTAGSPAPSAAARIPFTGEQGYHQGIDISTEKGKPVFATADGTVESASYAGDYGNLIVLKHGFGLMTRYGHLSAYTVKAGQVGEARRRHRLRRIHRPLDRRPPALRDSRQR